MVLLLLFSHTHTLMVAAISLICYVAPTSLPGPETDVTRWLPAAGNLSSPLGELSCFILTDDSTIVSRDLRSALNAIFSVLWNGWS
jgi:hypothetical protein